MCVCVCVRAHDCMCMCVCVCALMTVCVCPHLQCTEAMEAEIRQGLQLVVLEVQLSQPWASPQGLGCQGADFVPSQAEHPEAG